MFLATTALSEFWETDDEILFLGAWCLRPDRREEWASLQYRTLPFPYEDRERRYQAFTYVEGCYERMLERLADYFNRAHGMSYSLGYYRLLLSPWLLFYVHLLHERYVLLTDVLRTHDSLNTTVLEPESYRIPSDVVDFLRSMERDPYNLQLVSQIFDLLGYQFPKRSYAERKDVTVPGSRLPKVHRPIWRRVGKLLFQGGLAAAHRRAQVGIVAGGFSARELAVLAWRSGLRVLPFHPPELPGFCVNPLGSLRQGLSEIAADDEFERVLVGTLPGNFPGRYLEGFPAASESVRESIGKSFPEVIFSASLAFSQDRARFLIAEAAEQGARVLAGQHGGGYGMDRYHLHEQREKTCTDRYYVWGWADQACSKTRNLPSPKLSRMRRAKSGQPGANVGSRGILLVVAGQPRYNVKFWSGPVVTEWDWYREWEARFVSGLPEALHEEIIIRSPPSSRRYAGDVRKQIRSKLGPSTWDTNVDFSQSLLQCRLVVVDYPSTTCLEALHAGTPTLLFWDPALWEMRPAAEQYLSRLRDAGILWDSPEGAARHLKSVEGDIPAWWNAAPVQEARDEFVRRFALTAPDWLDVWADALRDEARLNYGPVRVRSRGSGVGGGESRGE